MTTLVVIPARWGSTRFPGKPLAMLAGKPMIAHVWAAARAATGIDRVIVATDDDRILSAVAAFGGEAVMTRSDHASGSDRLAEVAARIDADVYINVQGDEPLVRPADLAALAAVMHDARIACATLCHAIDAEEAANPNRVKLVRDAAGDALYFSRAMIPYPREPGHARYLQHVGVYAYRRAVVEAFPGLPRPAEEQAEALEQLRLLAAGIRIRTTQIAPTGPGVDTPEDLARVAELIAAR
jgi:3-deoxy-manno-octulosonate cytidylyltransferase (CMP-KDO synthetase)